MSADVRSGARRYTHHGCGRSSDERFTLVTDPGRARSSSYGDHMSTWAAPQPRSRLQPGASPIAVDTPRRHDARVTILTQPVRVERQPGHGWTPERDAVALVLGETAASLRDVVLRLPGEHVLDGEPSIAEVQLRFTALQGAAVILSIPVRGGHRSPELAQLGRGVLDLQRLLPGRRLASYAGTETVPPFQIPVMWLVSTVPLEARVSQLAGFVVASGRALPPRSLQPADGRPVVGLRASMVRLHEPSDTSIT